jgi:hypothetical protein
MLTSTLGRAQLMLPGAVQASSRRRLPRRIRWPPIPPVPRQANRDSSHPRRRRFPGSNCRATLPGSSPFSMHPAKGLRSPSFRSPEKKFRIQVNNARSKWSRGRRSKRDSLGGPMAYGATKSRSKLARFRLMCWREPFSSLARPAHVVSGRPIAASIRPGFGAPWEHYRCRSDEAVGARAGPR